MNQKATLFLCLYKQMPSLFRDDFVLVCSCCLRTRGKYALSLLVIEKDSFCGRKTSLTGYGEGSSVLFFIFANRVRDGFFG